MAELAPSTKPAPLEPSALGTKEYWDALYTTELVNHAADPADEGTVWFDDSDAQDKVLAYLDELLLLDSPGADAGDGNSIELNKRTTTFLDLGCGNGALLFGLRDAGWRGRLLGVDYSAQSVALARQVGEARAASVSGRDTTENEEEEEKDQEERDDRQEEGVVDFLVWDVLNGPLDAVDAGAGGWDVVLDKGTFDAVSLSDERDARGRRVCEGYRPRVLRLLRPGGLFLVTSCNWTEAELRAWFSGDEEEEEEEEEEEHDSETEVEGKLRPVGRIAYRSFSFGGVKGQTISTVCFAKVI